MGKPGDQPQENKSGDQTPVDNTLHNDVHNTSITEQQKIISQDQNRSTDPDVLKSPDGKDVQIHDRQKVTENLLKMLDLPGGAVVIRTDFDEATGKLKYAELAGGSKHDDSYTIHQYKFDPKTEQPLSHDERHGNGFSYHEEFEPTTGKTKSVDMKKPDGSTYHSEMQYDTITGQVMTCDLKNWDGAKTHTVYDPITGGVSSSETLYPDGHKELVQFFR